MSIIVAILFAVILFSVLIFVHELGHFTAAKLSGVQVNEFSMFMGPAIAKWRRGETLYSIRCIPVGGYCAMEGEDEDTDNPCSFQKAAWWKRLIILAAGSFMNFVIGVVIVSIVLFCEPGYTTTELAQVEDWSSVAVEGGLQPGDVIVSFDGQKIRIYEDFALATTLVPNGSYDVEVIRNGQNLILEDVPFTRQAVDDGYSGQQMRYGIRFKPAQTTPDSVPGRIFPTAFNYVKTVIVSLKMMLTGQAGLKDMTGAVGIVQIMSQSAAAAETTSGAMLNMLFFGGFIAINLAVMNILPIPALDGGRIVGLLLTTAVEKVTRRKIDPKFEGYVHAIGMIALLALMAIITFKDIFTIIKG